MNPFLYLFSKDNVAERIELWRKQDTLQFVLPELYACIGVPGGEYHNETVYEHLIAALKAAKGYTPQLKVAVLCHDIGKPEAIKVNPDGTTTFHSHEVKSASLAFGICKRVKLSKKDTDYIVKMVRHHMFRFDKTTKDKAIRKWLFKVGPEWEDLFLLRIADRKANKANKNKPVITKQMRTLKALIKKIIESDVVVFKEDLAITQKELKDLLKKRKEKQISISEANTNLIGLVNSDPTRNTKEWLIDYVQRIYQ